MNDLEFVSTQDLIKELTGRTTWVGILITATEEIKVSIGEERTIETRIYYQNMDKDGVTACLQKTIEKMETWEN